MLELKWLQWVIALCFTCTSYVHGSVGSLLMPMSNRQGRNSIQGHCRKIPAFYSSKNTGIFGGIKNQDPSTTPLDAASTPSIGFLYRSQDSGIIETLHPD